MKKNIYFILSLVLTVSGCITQFIPEISENREMLVVEGMLTDQPGGTSVKLSRSLPLGEKVESIPVGGAYVMITDDLGQQTVLRDTWGDGIYTTGFAGVAGRSYFLTIRSTDGIKNYTYRSYPMELKPVPPIEAIYYEKKAMESGTQNPIQWEGCQVYLDTRDPSNESRFFRWDFEETWEIRLPYDKALNKICWVTDNSHSINVKSTAGMSQSVVSRYPVNFISNTSDRLRQKYSMLIHQYSVTEDEFIYWEKLKAVTQDVGSLYDVTPATIPNNIFCLENPSERVLGYFSVSAKTSARIFIRDSFLGVPNMYPYSYCIGDTITDTKPILGLNTDVWILESDMGPCPICPYRVITFIKGCADCTVRGTNVRPDFWQ